MRRFGNFRPGRGFTLVEMLTTLSVIGVLLAIAAPGLRSLALNQGVKSAAFDLFSALQYARSEAIKRPGQTVTLKSGATSDGAWSTGWRLVFSTPPSTVETSIRTWTAASNISIADKNSPALTAVSFTNDGHASAAPKLEVKSASTVNGVSTRCVKVDLIGRPLASLGPCS